MKTVCIGMRNLLVWVFLATNVFAQTVPPDGDNSATNNESPLNSVSDYGTNLWLSISLSNNAVQLLLHNTQPGVPYLIRSRENLVSGSWFSEMTVTGAIAATTTPAVLNAGELTRSLFFQVLSWTTSTDVGTPVMVAIGNRSIMELTASGDVVTWGENPFGQFGDYTFLDSTNPVHVTGLKSIVKIASGLNHSLALDSAGILWAWGRNDYGQLGNNDTSDIDIPLRVSGMTNVIATDAHGYVSEGTFARSAAVKADGTVWTWGYSMCISGGGYTPVQIAGITNAAAVAVGACHAVALTTEGTVWMWENDDDLPVPVSGLSNIVAVCAGDAHTLALAADGKVWAWGYNYWGELGDGKAEGYSGVPVLAVGLTNVVRIAAGAQHSLAMDAQGNLWGWGDDTWGQLADGGFNRTVSVPTQVVGVTNVTLIAAGVGASVVLDGNGTLWQCGRKGSDWPYQEWGDNNGHPKPAPVYVDFYNGWLPDLQILSGNNQKSHAGMEFPQPLVVKVIDMTGRSLSNAPISMEVVAGDMELRTVSGGDNYKGLRLTADSNGEVTVFGYTDSYVFNPNCLVRVLAASRERIVEADFNATIIPAPTISIISPVDGSTFLIGTNQPLTVTVDAEAAPGASIKEVDYYYQTNGGASTLLAVLTQPVYSLAWTNSAWWTNSFVGQYTITAVAVDDAGARSDPQSVNITVALDSDANGLPDYWEMRYFGATGVDLDADPDGDGYSNWQEYQYNIDPTDFYNGRLPCLEILSGNDRTGNYDSFLPMPVNIKVSESQFFTTSINNAPVTFTVTNGTALLAATTNDIPTNSIVLRSDLNGQVSVWVYFPPFSSGPPDSTILASAISGTSRATVTVNEFVPLGHWRFDDTNSWAGEAGQLPLSVANVAGTHSWSGDAVFVPGVNPAFLSYQVVETNGATNVTCQTGSVLFWFKPDWSSASVGGNGPGAWGRLLEMGNYNPAFTNGWWSLYLNPDGTQLSFGTSTNGGGMTNLSATISWYSNEWYQIALTYSPARSALYVDVRLLASGAGVNDFPNTDELLEGFRIGSDCEGNNQADGAFDELRTFNYPLAAANAATYSGCIPDWWEVKYFGRNGMDPDSVAREDGSTLWISYWDNRDPNVINFSLSAANQSVNHRIVPIQINIQNGEPSAMAVAINTTNFVIDPYQLFDPGNNFIATPWQPYNSNIVVSLNSGERDYYVWVGLKGPAPEARQTWHATRLTLDTAPPVLTITNPADGVASRPIIQMQGCANESLSSLTYDISNAAGVWTNQTAYITGQFCDMNLLAITTNYFQGCNIILESNGVNIITLHAIDLAGNETATNFVFTFDPSTNTNPPVLTVLWPQTGTSIGGSNFTLQAQVSDPMTTVTASIVDGDGNESTVPGLVEQSGSAWVEDLPLGSGTNTLTVAVTDMVGKTCTTNLILFRSDVIATLNPLSEDQFNQSFINVSGTINDSSCAITVNGAVANVNADGTWEADTVPAHASGTALFDVEAASSEGGSSSQTFAATQPVKVGLMSYLKNESPASGLIGGGIYCAVSPCCGPAYGNNGNTIKWNYQAGGSDSGYNYSSGYFNSSPGAPGSIMISAPGYFDWSNALPSGQDAYAAPWEIRSDAQGYYRTQVMIESEGKKAAGTMVTYLFQAQVWGNQLAPGLLRINGVPLIDDGMGSGHIIFSAPADLNMNVTPIAPGNYSFAVQATDLGMELVVDNKRDGQITFDGRDATTPANPYRFWINDSQESDDVASGSDAQIPGIEYTNLMQPDYPNFSHDQVQGRSDLVNFFPIALNFGTTLQLAPPSDGYEYHLYQVDRAAIGGAVKFAYTSLTPIKAFDYLTDANSSGYGTNFNEAAMEADTIPIYPDTVLDTNWLARVQKDGGVGIILVEGCAATPHPLMLEIWRNGRLLAGTPLYLSISGVEQMFRHVNLSYVNGRIEVPPRDDAPNEPSPNDKNFVFLHGYNVSQQQACGTESEIFKRMYWSGSKAKFYGVTWNGAVSQGDYIANICCNYQTNIVNAFQTAPHLADFLGTLPANKTVVAAHSLGNLVVLSAISDYNATISKYFMIDAAVPMEAVQANMPFEPAMIPSGWQQYSNRTFASDWWQLFANSDGRSTLTWNDRLGNLGGVDIYNLYSPGEEVLREDDEDTPSSILSGGATQLINYWAGVPFGTYAWVWQEKGKGIAHFDDFISSTHGGWRFPVNAYSDPNPVPPGTANSLSDSALQQAPIFDFGSRFDQIDGPFPDLALINATTGSAYAQANRDRILSDAIPALTLPAGANNVSILDQRVVGKRNLNMQNEFETGWPSSRFTSGERNNNWHHSDFSCVAFPFIHKLFDEIANDGNLKLIP